MQRVAAAPSAASASRKLRDADHADAPARRRAAVRGVLQRARARGPRARAAAPSTFCSHAADRADLAVEVDGARDRDLAALGEAVAAERVVDLEREREPRRRPAAEAARRDRTP